MASSDQIQPPHTHKELTFKQKLLDLKYRIGVVVPSKIALYRALIQRGFAPKRIIFYPREPKLWHIMYSMCHQLGYSMTTDVNAEADLAVYFDDETRATTDPVLDQLKARGPVINGNCLDIGKERVEAVHKEVFGYGMEIDPETETGIYVRKSNENTAHDGKIIEGPSKREPGYVYQKLIDTAVGDKVVDTRVIIMNGTIPFVMHRFKSVHDRFDNTERSAFVDLEKEFSKDEIVHIIAFCKKFGLDCGELDVLRDTHDGKIYIVDANKTSGGPRPGKHVTPEEYKEFLKMMTDSFKAAFLTNQK